MPKALFWGQNGVGDSMNRKKNGIGATQKAAKKTYPRKKTPPKPRRITLDDLVAVVAESEARMAKSREETDKAIRESREETDKAIRESHERTDKALQKLSDNVDRLSTNIGHVSNDMGELMEFIVIPKIRLAMNATGKHDFKTMQTERELKKNDVLGEKKTLTEVDVLLYGDTEAMAVETKSHLFTRDVKKHKERLEMLRQHEDLIDISGKKLLGAVVGAVVDEGAKKFALDSGLYVVTIREEAEKLDVVEPETCRAW
jgi:hypothetical protein